MKRLIPILAVLVAAMAGFLTVRTNSTNQPATLENRGTHYAVEVELDEATTGVVEADITVQPTAETVSLFAVMPQMGHSTPEIAALKGKAGRFVARGELFTMSGAWELAVRVQGRPGTEVIKVNVLVGER